MSREVIRFTASELYEMIYRTLKIHKDISLLIMAEGFEGSAAVHYCFEKHEDMPEVLARYSVSSLKKPTALPVFMDICIAAMSECLRAHRPTEDLFELFGEIGSYVAERYDIYEIISDERLSGAVAADMICSCRREHDYIGCLAAAKRLDKVYHTGAAFAAQYMLSAAEELKRNERRAARAEAKLLGNELKKRIFLLIKNRDRDMAEKLLREYEIINPLDPDVDRFYAMLHKRRGSGFRS